MKTVSFNQGPRVLVVDDHRISRLHTVQALRQTVSHVKQARTVEGALHLALDQLPQLIFLDVHLEDSSGLSLLERIRQSWPPDSALPRIVVLTGDNSSGLRQELEQASVSAVLIKPVQSSQIRAITMRLLQLDGAVRERPTQEACAAPEQELQKIFLEELTFRLPQLDKNIADLEWGSARRILHQLIASCAMCQEKVLEQHCRNLFRALEKCPQPRVLAQAYYPFRQAFSQMR